MSSNSVCNHTCDKQIGLLLRSRRSMITDRIGLHSVPLPLVIFLERPLILFVYIKEMLWPFQNALVSVMCILQNHSTKIIQSIAFHVLLNIGKD